MNCMPASVKDRFTIDFEYVYFFTKNEKYFFEQQFEPHSRDWTNCGGSIFGRGKHKKHGKMVEIEEPRIPNINPLGRNKRCVWHIPENYMKLREDLTEEQRLLVFNCLMEAGLV